MQSHWGRPVLGFSRDSHRRKILGEKVLHTSRWSQTGPWIDRSTVGSQKLAQHPAALPPLLGLQRLLPGPLFSSPRPSLPSLTVPQRWRRVYVPSQPRSWALWTDLLTGRLRGPKLQGQALLCSWSLVNSQWEWEPEERGETVSDLGSQPFHTGLLT